MKQFEFTAIALAIGVGCSSAALAQTMSENDYGTGRDAIEARYQSAVAGCAVLSGNANAICVAEAKGGQSVAAAELEVRYNPSAKIQYQARIAKAEAAYAVAHLKCDDTPGNASDDCLEQVSAAQITAKSEARARMKITVANAAADTRHATP